MKLNLETPTPTQQQQHQTDENIELRNHTTEELFVDLDYVTMKRL